MCIGLVQQYKERRETRAKILFSRKKANNVLVSGSEELMRRAE